MKKTLLSVCAVALTGLLNAQVIISDNFDAYFPGNVGTDYTGTTPTNNIYTLSSNGLAPTTATNAGNDNFQIVSSDAEHVNALQITGTNGDKGSRVLWYEGFTDAWDARTPGNDIIEAEFELFTGTTGVSKNRMGLYIYDVTRTKILGGFSFDTSTLALSGVAYYESDTATAGNYLFYLGGGSNNLILPANTWMRLGVSFNKTTGEVLLRDSGTLNGSVMGAASGTDPDRVSFVSTSGTTTTAPIVINTAAASTLFDNFIVRASATDTLLGVSQVAQAAITGFMVYPNPVNNVLSISNGQNAKITTLVLTDMNGRVVKQSAYNVASDVDMNVSDLSAGVYMLSINSDKGIETQKIVKN